MTMQEWKQTHQILPTHPTTEMGAICVCCTVGTQACKDLYNLTDYKVSTRIGVVIWLLPNRGN